MGTRVLLVGLDAADRGLVNRWAASGALPTIARLQREGVSGTLAPLFGLGDDAVWSSFSTATTPSRHGRWYHARLGPDGVSLEHVTRDQTLVPPFWDALATAGKRVAVVDVPKSPIGAGASVVVADWMPHGGDEPRAVFSDAARARGLDRRISPDPTFDCDRRLRTARKAAEFERRLAARARARRDLVQTMLVDDDGTSSSPPSPRPTVSVTRVGTTRTPSSASTATWTRTSPGSSTPPVPRRRSSRSH